MESYKPHQKRFVIFFVTAMAFVAAINRYAGGPWWQIAAATVFGAVVFWVRINSWRR